jgi:hypothetical protein
MLLGLGLPIFISECGFGGIRKRAPINFFVCVRSSLVMAKIQTVELPVPANAKTATLHVRIDPPTGSVLIRSAEGTNDKPTKFHGPQQIGAIPLTSKFVTVELADGAKGWELKVNAYTF